MSILKQHFKALLIVAFVFAASLTGCNTPPVIEPDDDNTGGEVVTPEDSTFTRMIVNPVDFEFRAADTTVKVRVSSTAAWAIGDTDDWYTISPKSGKAGDTQLTLTVSANYDGKVRSTDITVATTEEDLIEKTIHIEQSCYYDVTASVNTFEADWAGGEFSTDIISDKDWAVVGAPDWLTIKPSEGPKGTCTLDLAIEPYEEFGERSAIMTFAGNFDTSDTLYVHQTGRLIFETTSPLSYEIPAIGDTMEFNVRSNVLFSAEYSERWLRCELTEGQPSPEVQTFKMLVTKNYNTKRQGYIRLVAAEGDSTIVFNFTQLGSQEVAIGNEITAFRLLKVANPGLSKDISFTIAGDSIVGYVPDASINLKSITPNFTASQRAKVYANDVRQQSGSTKVDFSKPVTYIVVAENGKERHYKVVLKFFTGIPVLYINTNSGFELSSRDTWESSSFRLYSSNESEQIPSMTVKAKALDDASWSTTSKKRSYEMTFTSAQSILDLPARRNWSLISNYADKTMLRNQVALELGRATELDWVPSCTPVELILNDTYRGTYLLCEPINNENNTLHLGDYTTTKGGYLLSADRHITAQTHSFTSKYMTGSLFAPTDHATIQVKIPSLTEGNTSLFGSIEQEFSAVEEAICNNKGDWSKALELIDLGSIVDQWLIYEITATTEPARGPYNYYMHKRANDSKIYGGPLWDFDFQSFIPTTQAQWVNNSTGWIPYLWNCPEFRSTAKAHWDAYKAAFYKVASTYITEQAKYLEKPAEENWKLHNQNLIDDGRTENGDERLSSTEAVARMQAVLKARLDWLDKQFADWGEGGAEGGADATIDRVESDNTDKNKENFWN